MDVSTLRHSGRGMASFILLLGLCSLAVAKPVTSNTVNFVANGVATADTSSSDGYVGCYREGTDGRALTRASLSHPRLTVGACEDFCRGDRYYGLEYGNECYCGYSIRNAAYQVPDSSCTVPCVGDHKEICGGGDLLSIYKSNFTFQQPMVKYTAQGCYGEPQGSRALHRVLSSAKMTSNKCLVLCSYNSFYYAGLQFGTECWCGNSLDPNAKPIDQSKCSIPCGGDSSETCGGSLALQLFMWDGGMAPLAS
ncbi:hypothetical protein Daus18300_007850 [Diaporthe australafricana]|uniref:WSC domain-containing protein n=1 Tax=Diaporthe australafricana TaxID=127596 RepID=A0ABR3WL00_9PEZI